MPRPQLFKSANFPFAVNAPESVTVFPARGLTSVFDSSAYARSPVVIDRVLVTGGKRIVDSQGQYSWDDPESAEVYLRDGTVRRFPEDAGGMPDTIKMVLVKPGHSQKRHRAPSRYARGMSTILGGGGPYTDEGSVRLFQTAVTSLGLQNPVFHLVVDGKWGSKTKAAVARWNAEHSISGDMITDATLASLPATTVIPKAKPEPSRPTTTFQPTPGGGGGARAIGPAAEVTAEIKSFLDQEVMPGVPLWQAGLGVLGAAGLGYAVYRMARR